MGKAKKVHIPWTVHTLRDPCDASLTLCGRFIPHLGERQVIRNGQIKDATCLVCLGSDDRLQVEQHRRECAAAKIDPDTLEPLRRTV
jgi:hypothetical protein